MEHEEDPTEWSHMVVDILLSTADTSVVIDTFVGFVVGIVVVAIAASAAISQRHWTDEKVVAFGCRAEKQQ